MIKRIIFILLLIIITGSFYFHQKAYAQVSPTPVDYKLPFPGILPDHPLYPLKRLRDKILISMTSKPVKKVEIYLLFSDKNLVMGQLLWERAKYDLGLKTFEESEQLLLKSAVSLVKLKQGNNLPPGLADKIELSGKKHGEIILSLQGSPQNQEYSQSLQDVLAINHQAIQQIDLIK